MFTFQNAKVTPALEGRRNVEIYSCKKGFWEGAIVALNFMPPGSSGAM
jgi:hypothetical protein